MTLQAYNPFIGLSRILCCVRVLANERSMALSFLFCIIYLAAIGVIGFIVGRLLPHRLLDENRFPFRPFSFEKDGRIYEKIGIKKWQSRIPDMSRMLPRFMPAKKLEKDFAGKLPVMIKETCVAELIHLILALLAPVCLYIRRGIGGIVLTVLYELGNLSFILVQRYNRPRLLRLQQKLDAKV